MPKELPEKELGGHWEQATLDLPGSGMRSRTDEQRQRVTKLQRELRGVFASLVRKAGGTAWLQEALDEKPSYESKIIAALNGAEDRKIQLDWFAAVLDAAVEDEPVAELLMQWLSDRLGYEPAVRKRRVSREQIAAAAAEVVAETTGAMKDAMREAIAKKLGVRPEDVKL